MRWGWASHPVNSIKKLGIEVISQSCSHRHTKPGFCFWCVSGNYFFGFKWRWRDYISETSSKETRYMSDINKNIYKSL